MITEGKDRFIKVYSNLNFGVRKEVILLIENKPITWNVAYNEIVESETELGKKILKKIIEMKLI